MRPLRTTALLAAIACGDPVVDRPDGAGLIDFDAGVADPPPPPMVDPLPSAQPYPVLSVRGRARDGRRIYVEGAGNRRSYGVQPDGTFCADVPLAAPSQFELFFLSQARDGQLSEPSGPITVVYDPRAPGRPDAVTCTGADPAGCASAFEICGNGIDDNCNGLIDEQDPQCAPCQDDVLEPNDEPGSPRIPANRTYEALMICPGNPDWYGVHARAGQTIRASIHFSHANGDLDLELLAINQRDVLASSRTLNDIETVTRTATAAGTYHLHVFGNEITSNRYRLELSVSP